ncbi:MAG TPA: acetaldehyde dehydrogenase (acetylating) [Bacillota bacterium]|nr:acetaldehyde dehydrogenase (acetylating) [Bacillota bacterium]HPL54327.1 acetaldehyde dehydrogenase (acetylating) [Bacillota bacterium]
MEVNDLDLLSIQEADTLIDGARKAQIEFSRFSQEEIDEIVRCIAEIAERESERLARLAVDETGFGVYEHKAIKNRFASRTVYESIKDLRTVGIINEDKKNKILEIAAPVGVIGALVPCTNPTSTVIFKTLIAVKSGNAIVFSPHPSALKCIMETTEVLKDIAHKVGAPEDLISCMSMPTLKGTAELMRLSSLILATGGSAMVKAAYSSGVPALGVGPGNTPAFIERSADIPLAVKRIIAGKTFDNGTICSSEQSIVTEDCIMQDVKKELADQGAYFVEGNDMKLLAKLIQKPGGGLNPGIVGQPAAKLAEMAGIKVPYGAFVLVCEQTGVGKDYPFSMEKLSPILAFYTEENRYKACMRCIELLEYGGMGHTLAIHSNNEKVIREFALKKPVSRLLINTSSSLGAIGATTNLLPSLTLGCGTIGGNATSDNVGVMHLINIRRAAYGVREAEELVPRAEEKISNIDINMVTRLVLERLRELNKKVE